MLFFDFFLTFLIGIIGLGFILLVIGAGISVVERISDKIKGKGN